MSSLTDTLKSLSDLVHYSRRPLPTAPDGLTDAQAASFVLEKPEDHGRLYDFIDDIQSAIRKGLPVDLDEQTLLAVVDAIRHAQTTGIDDRYLLLEKVFTLISRLPSNSTAQNKLQDAIISLLYNDLPHPPATYLGKKYAFRAADGLNNSITVPSLGQARMPYTRTVQAKNPIPYSSLPDPELLFDTLLKRDGTKSHPSGISSLLFAFANLIIHSLFKTDEKFKHINNTSSYLDLSPLYGDSEAAQRSVRVQDGRGLIWEDTFADQRMLMMPPSTPALLVIFARNHNYIARNILKINERRCYADPPPTDDPAALMNQDDDIFNKARLVNCGHFINIILSDYIGAILGLTRDGNDFTLNPLEAIREGLKRDLVGRGQGNAVSVEFNLLYRWHATISVPDEKWTEDLFRRMFPDKPWHSLTPADFQQRVRELRTGPSSSAATAPVPPPTSSLVQHNIATAALSGSLDVDDKVNSVMSPPTTPPLTPISTNAPLQPVSGRATPPVSGNIYSNGHGRAYSNGHSQLHAQPSIGHGGHVVRSHHTHTHTQEPSSSTIEPPPRTKAGLPTTGPSTWVFGNLKRDEQTGRFDDDALAGILHSATETVAQAFRARGTPEVMKVVEMIGIEQARSWGVCTLNEFRQYLGLKEYDSFEEWNPDPEIANAARALYGHIDNLELYVGMQAEEAKVPGEGAGLCPGYTISRAILGDAVALTRGDRFFTHDFNPYNLTAWGYQDCAHTPTNGAFGGGISKLLFRSLPNNFSFNSVYGLFPFYTPKTCEVNLSKLDLVDKYDFERPKTEKPVVSVNTWDGVKQVLGDYRSFKTTYEEHMKALTNGYGFFLAFDDPAKHLADMKIVRDALFPNDQAFEAYGEFYRDTTARLIEEKSFSLVGKGTRSVDIVRDVLNLVPVHWVSRKVAGIPLKTPQTPDGVHTEQEVYQYLAVVFTYIFLNVDPANGWPLRANAEKVAKLLQGYTKGHIDAMRSTTVLGRLKDTLLGWVTGEKTDDLDFLRRLAASGRSSDVLAYNVFGIIIASSPNFSQAAAQVVNFYLDDARAKERKEVVRLCHSEAPEDNKLLLGYIMEAMRLDPQAPGIFREAARDADVVEGNDVPSVKVTKGQRLFVSLYNANHDPSVFGPDPSAIDPTRSPDVYMTFGSGMHKCLGQWFVLSVMPQVMRSIFTLKNVRRAPGESGKLNRFQQRLYGSTPGNLYIDARGNVTPWPASMTIQYDI